MNTSERQIADAIARAESCAQPHQRGTAIALIEARIALREFDRNAQRWGRHWAYSHMRRCARSLHVAIDFDRAWHPCHRVLERLAHV